MRGRAEGQNTLYTLATILGEPFIAEISGLHNFEALTHAQIMIYFLKFYKMRAWAGRRKKNIFYVIFSNS